jgi:aminoglycoside phosphotransferase (APT) family kinase protein
MSFIQDISDKILFNNFFKSNHLVHGDFYNENILLDKSNRVISFLDLEEIHLGHRMEDIAKFLLYACFNSEIGNNKLTLAKSFLKQYSKQTSITNEEIQFGIYFELYRMCSSLFIEKLLYKTKDLSLVNLLERDLKKIQFFKENLLRFIEDLCY